MIRSPSARRATCGDARIVAAGLDRLAVGDRLELRLRRELQVVEMRLAERAIFVGLRDERVAASP